MKMLVNMVVMDPRPVSLYLYLHFDKVEVGLDCLDSSCMYADG